MARRGGSARLVVSDDKARELVAKGLIPESAVQQAKKRVEKLMIESSICLERPERIVFALPIQTASEANARAWKEKSARNRNARNIVAKFMAKHARQFLPFNEHYHAGGTLALTFIRLGCRSLDTLANLGTSLKGVEDAVAMMLGADDGSPRWQARAEQAPATAYVGVQIIITIVK
jgi:hypothetical protein